MSDFYFNPYGSDELYHHGILGMRWGIRRYQNKDGSLTPDGKKRYNTEDTKATASNKSTESQTNSSISVKKEIDTYNAEHKSEANAIKASGEKLAKVANELGDDYNKLYKSLKNDPSFIDNVWKKLNSELSDYDYTDDKDMFDWDKSEIIDSVIAQHIPSDMSRKLSDFSNLQNKYWSDVKTYTDGLANKYEGKTVYGINPYITDGKEAVASSLRDTLDTRYTAYLSRHFEDYWVNDVESRYELQNSFTYDEYLKRHK